MSGERLITEVKLPIMAPSAAELAEMVGHVALPENHVVITQDDYELQKPDNEKAAYEAGLAKRYPPDPDYPLDPNYPHPGELGATVASRLRAESARLAALNAQLAAARAAKH